MNLFFHLDHIRAELDKHEFLEIVNDFIKENQSEYKKFLEVGA